MITISSSPGEPGFEPFFLLNFQSAQYKFKIYPGWSGTLKWVESWHPADFSGALKRLYQQGYKGKFGFFSWPTEWFQLNSTWYSEAKAVLSDPQHYDRSEVVARKSGAGPLHDLLLKLNARFGASHLHVFAHSMGNVVVGGALKADTGTAPLIDAYIACLSAEVAHAYDPTLAPNSTSTNITDRYRYNPPVQRSNASQKTQGANYEFGISSRVNRKFFNFVNVGDQALGGWDLNQKFKPDDGWLPSDTAYSYSSDTQNFIDIYKEDPPGTDVPNQEHEIYWPADRFTILAHITPARSRATGATRGVAGEFAGEIDLGGPQYLYGNGDFSHSAEFLSSFVYRRQFYFDLLNTFRLSPDPIVVP